MLIKNLKEIKAEMLNVAKEINDVAASDLIQDIAKTFHDHMRDNYPENEVLADDNLDPILFARLHLKAIIQESRRAYELQHNQKSPIKKLLHKYYYNRDSDLFDLIESHLTKVA